MSKARARITNSHTYTYTHTHRAAERKTHQTQAAMQKVEDSITPQQRAQALRAANQKRRHDMRAYNVYSLCSRTRLIAVSMLGFALRVDRHLIVACCSCLGYTKVSAAHWYVRRQPSSSSSSSSG